MLIGANARLCEQNSTANHPKDDSHLSWSQPRVFMRPVVRILFLSAYVACTYSKRYHDLFYINFCLLIFTILGLETFEVFHERVVDLQTVSFFVF